MAKPQLEDGFLTVANEIAEALAKVNLSPYESRILWAIFRKTYGWRKKEDRISFSQFQEITDLKRQHASRAVASLLARKIIYRKGTERKITYGIQKDYSQWEDAHTSPAEVTYSSPEEVTSEPEKSEEAQAITSPAEVTSTPEEIMSPAEVKSSPPEVTNTSPSEGHTKDKKETIQKTDILSVFDFWNSCKIISHEKVTTAMETAIKHALKEFGKAKVMQAMTNYGQLLNGDYDWTYKWTLQEFLTRGGGNNIERFKDMEVLRQNYGRRRNEANKKNPRKLPEAGGYTRPEDYRKTT